VELKTVKTQHVPVRYLEAGKGPDLVFLHGAGGVTAEDPFLAEVAKTHHVYAPLIPGYGDSEEAPEIRDMLDFTLHGWDTVEALGLKDPILVGHSMGGMIALAYAGTYPEKVSRLVVLDGAFLSSAQSVPIAEQMSRWINQLDRIGEHQESTFQTIEDAAKRLSARNKRLTAAQALHLAGHGVRKGDDGLYRWKFDHHQRARAPYRLSADDYAALWSRITCPTLLMWGDESFLPDPEAAGLLAHFKNAAIEKIAGAGHWLHHDRLDVVLASLRRFLGVTPSAPQR